MALELRTTTAFERDLRRVNKQGKDLDKLETIVNTLQDREQLPARCRPHPLSGIWAAGARGEHAGERRIRRYRTRSGCLAVKRFGQGQVGDLRPGVCAFLGETPARQDPGPREQVNV
jgi:mRNA interferase YafQ